MYFLRLDAPDDLLPLQSLHHRLMLGTFQKALEFVLQCNSCKFHALKPEFVLCIHTIAVQHMPHHSAVPIHPQHLDGYLGLQTSGSVLIMHRKATYSEIARPLYWANTMLAKA